MKYVVTMEYIGHHEVEFEAEDEEDALNKAHHYNIPEIEDECMIQHIAEECLIIEVHDEEGDPIWQI